MTPSGKITRADLDRANPKLVKFIGVVESVMCDVAVGRNGHRKTIYRVSGPDWAVGFRDTVYLDPGWQTITRDHNPISQMVYMRTRKLAMDDGLHLQDFTTENNLKLINTIWMNTSLYDDKINQETEADIARSEGLARLRKAGIYAIGTNVFSIPEEVLSFMGYELSPSKFHELPRYLEFKLGKIDENGEYDNQKGWPYSIIKAWDPNSILGNYSAWQLYNSVNAENIEELFNDLYFCTDTANDTNHQPFNLKMPSLNDKMPSLNDKFSLGNFNLDPSFMNSLNNVPLLNNNQPNAKVSKKLKFTLFNRIMPFYIRNPIDSERFYKEGSEETNISLKYIDPRSGELTDKKTHNSVQIKEYRDSRSNFNKESLIALASMYCNLPKTEIPLNEIMGISYYVDAMDRINLLEMEIHPSIANRGFAKNIPNILKYKTQEWEHVNLFSRDGLKMKKFSISHWLVSDKMLKAENQPQPKKTEEKVKIPSKKSLEVGFKAKQAEKEIDEAIKKAEERLKSGVGQTWEDFINPNVSMEKKK
jgi:hypothetical protein